MIWRDISQYSQVGQHFFRANVPTTSVVPVFELFGSLITKLWRENRNVRREPFFWEGWNRFLLRAYWIRNKVFFDYLACSCKCLEWKARRRLIKKMVWVIMFWPKYLKISHNQIKNILLNQQFSHIFRYLIVSIPRNIRWNMANDTIFFTSFWWPFHWSHFYRYLKCFKNTIFFKGA